MLHARSAKGTPILIEELAIPGSLRRLFEETISTAHLLHTLDRRDEALHAPSDPDPCAVDRKAIERTSIFALMGDDGARGAIELTGGDTETDGDGAVRVRWPELSNSSLFGEQLQVLRDLADASDLRGTVIPNPLWRFVPESMADLFDSKLGPLFTVHPLGGCRMGSDWREGVVDHVGRVFKATSDMERAEQVNRRTATWPDLAVLDGSIVPSGLGTNPALTIAALALRAVEQFRKDWRLTKPAAKLPPAEPRRPFREIEPVAEVETEFQLIERLRGPAELPLTDGSRERCMIELTLRFRRFPLSHITGPDKEPLVLDPEQSKLRIYRERDWEHSRRLACSAPRARQARTGHGIAVWHAHGAAARKVDGE